VKSNISGTQSAENPSRESDWPFYVAPCAILLAPLIAFIDFHGYPLNSPEILLIIFGMIMVGIIIGALMKNMENLGRVLFLTILLEISLDLIADFELKGKIICVISAFLFSWFFRRNAPRILSFSFAIFIAVTLFLPSTQISPILNVNDGVSRNSDLPPVVHLILDAHIGAEGIPEDIGLDRNYKKDFISFYTDNGFRLFGNAYSRFQRTIDSVFSLLNFETGLEADNKVVKKHKRSDFANEITRNKYFQEMTTLGYKIKVYQTTVINYCQENFRIGSCYTYPLLSARILEDLSSTVGDKFWAILSSYLFRSDFIRTAKNAYWHLNNIIFQKTGIKLPFPWNWDGRRTTPIDASQALGKLKEDIQNSPEGTLFFAHLLMPHGPFVYKSNCQIYNNPVSEWALVSDPVYFGKENSISSRVERYKMYLRQVKCINKQLQELFDTMRSAKIYDKATIIIHGDHGSRIRIMRPTYADRNEITPEDLVDSFSALYAVKKSGQKAGYDLQTLSLNQLFPQAIRPGHNEEKNIDSQNQYVNLRVDGESFGRLPISILKNNQSLKIN